MKILTAGGLAVLLALASAGSLLAHHSLANHDTQTPVRVKGTVVRFHAINPHSILYVEENGPDGRMRRWAVEGPSIRILQRRGFAADVLKPGDSVEFCGYLPREATRWQVASPDPGAVSLSGQLITAELLVMPDGKIQNWEDYGFHKCFAPGYRDHHSK